MPSPGPARDKHDGSGAKTHQDEVVTDVVSAQAPAVGSAIANRKRSKLPLVILIVLLLAGATAAGLYFAGVLAL